MGGDTVSHFFCTDLIPQLFWRGQNNVKGTRRSLEIAFYPLTFPSSMDQQLSVSNRSQKDMYLRKTPLLFVFYNLKWEL